MLVSAGLISMVVLVMAQIPAPSLPQIHGFSTRKEVSVQVEIKASPNQVWRVLTDFPAYAIWNPYIYPASGDAAAGRTLDLTLRGKKLIHYTPTVLAARPGRELSWAGRLPANAITRVMTFEIHPMGPHQVMVTATEVFRGLLLPLAGDATDDSATGLPQMTRALRDRCELLDFSLPVVRK